MTSIRIAMRDGSAVTVPLRQMEHPVRRDGSGWTNWKDLREAMSARRPWAADERTVLNTRCIVKAELVEDEGEPERPLCSLEDRLKKIDNLDRPNVLTWGLGTKESSKLPEPPFKSPVYKALAYPERLPEELVKDLGERYQAMLATIADYAGNGLACPTTLLVQKAILSDILCKVANTILSTDEMVLAEMEKKEGEA